MSDKSTIVMLDAYLEKSDGAPGFFTQFFQTPKKNFHDKRKVKLDIQRSGRSVAPVLTALGVGSNRTERTDFTSKEFEPTVYSEEFALNSVDFLSRRAGYNPYEDVGFLRAVWEEISSEMLVREERIRRGIEIQASQCLSTGILTLPGVGGVTGFELDYKPKSTHFVGAQTDWDENNVTTRIKDLSALCDVIRDDGKGTPYYCLAGTSAAESLKKDAEYLTQVSATGTGLGKLLAPNNTNRPGGTYNGKFVAGNHELEFWAVTETYDRLSDGVTVPYLDPWKIVIVSRDSRLDLTFGAIPLFGQIDPRLAALPFGRVSSPEKMIDLVTNAYITQDRYNIVASVSSRPLCIPTAIDTYGCLDCKVT